MSSNHQAVRAVAQVRLGQKLQSPDYGLTSEDIQIAVHQAIGFLGCNDVDADAVVRDLESSYQTVIGTERTLVDRSDANYEPWLDKRRADIPWVFWNRYYQFLRDHLGWPTSVLDRLDQTTDRVLDLLTAPNRPGTWDRRGMIVGHVQSGKTANYTGLICKAADAGYKVIVVLAGFHNSLRSQTQIRLDEGFVGFSRMLESGQTKLRPVGVGHLDSSPKANSITTRTDDGDFKKAIAKNFGIHPGGNPLLFVIKKNATVLGHLLSWVESFANTTDTTGRRYLKDVPLLVIDDEADQGSIDTKKGAINEAGGAASEHDPVALNRSIRQLLRFFDQSAYVGYTATPFANIFIHEDAESVKLGRDLFPRSFIVALPTPSNYVSPATVFGYESEDGSVSISPLPICRVVNDHADSVDDTVATGWMPPRHKNGHYPSYKGRDEVPPSLKQAIRSFVLACAARAARGQTTNHNSMLVHVTRFNSVQTAVFEQVTQELSSIKQSLRYGDGEAKKSLRVQLKELWEDDFQPTTQKVVDLGRGQDCSYQEWNDIESYIEPAALSIKVRAINGLAGEVLDYVNHEQQGLNVIAIGGDKLSRGLTLEGLTVSYFLRASRMYDTLMQMGRWFGYRPGYLDLCRLYTTTEMTEWFTHIAAASEELRDDFNRMEASGGTPREFGHRVRSHPALMVTSQVKMRHGTELDVTFQGDICETINFWRDKNHLENNWLAAKQLFAKLESYSRKRNGNKDTAIMWTNVPALIVTNFLAVYVEHPSSKKVKTALLANYINLEVNQGRLKNWSVLLASGSGKGEHLNGSEIKLVQRSWHLTNNESEDELQKRDLITQNHYRIRRLVSPADEHADLTEQQRQSALSNTLADWEQNDRQGNAPTRPSGFRIRCERSPESGLLIIYLLDPSQGAKTTDTDKVASDARTNPIVAFAISFPQLNPDEASKVRYVVNNVYYKQELLEPEQFDEIE